MRNAVKVQTGDPLEIYFIPTTSYNLHSKGCDLFKLCSILNRGQSQTGQAFRFQVLLSNQLLVRDELPATYNSLGLVLQQRVPFQNFRFNEHCDTPTGIRAEAQKTYISDKDAFEQIRQVADNVVRSPAAEQALLVGIGAEVVSEDDPEAEFTGVAEDDAYSCLGNIMSSKDCNNNNEYDFQNVCFVSLAPSVSVFKELGQMGYGELLPRSIVSRYIVGNVCHFISGRIFAKNLNRDHGALCVAEANWTSDARASYAAKGLCEKCLVEIKSTGVAEKYKGRFSWLSGSDAIEAIATVCDRIDNAAAADVRLNWLMELAAIVLFAGLMVNLISGFDTTDGKGTGVMVLLGQYVVLKWPAFIAMIAALFVAGYVFTRTKWQASMVP